MTGVSVLLLFSSLFSGVLSEISLRESGPGAVKPSESLRLTCKVSGASITDRINMYGVGWIRQPTMKGLEWIGAIYYDESIYKASSLQSRLTLSRDTSKNEVYLQMTSMKPEDTAMYYCARPYTVGGNAFDVWGPGTFLTVSTEEKTAPSLYPMISCGASQNPTVIGCLAKRFMPGDITLAWTDGNNKNLTEGYTTYPSVYSTYYSTSSLITVPNTEGGSQEKYFCTATHSVLDKPKTIEVSHRTPKSPKIPIISIHPPSKEDWNSNSHKGYIVCMASDFYPEPITIKYLKNGKQFASGNVTNMLKKNDQGDFTQVSSLELTKKEWDSDALYTCEVNHPATEIHESRNISKSLASDVTECNTAIRVTAVRPSFEDFFNNKEAQLVCVVANMESAVGLNISWYKMEKGKELEMKTKISDPVYQGNLYSATGTATVCATEWNGGETFTCKVVHPDLVSTETKSLSKGNENLSPPSVHIFPPHSEELALKESATVTCLAKGYSPQDMFVKWLVQDQEVKRDDYVNSEPITETNSSGDQVFSIYSKLTIEEKSWSRGDSVTCMVGHEALPLQVISKTTDKSSGKPTFVNVSLVMSDSTSTCNF